MEQDIVVRGTEESCRQKAEYYVEKMVREKLAFNPYREIFGIYKEIYETAKYASQRSRENIQDGNHMRHVADPCMVVRFETAHRVAVLTMEIACAEMEKLENPAGEKLCKVNGTSLAFEKCVQGLSQEKIHVPQVMEIVTAEVMNQGKSSVTEKVADKISLTMAQLAFAFFVAFPDVTTI